MNYIEFIQSVASRPMASPAPAEPITRATLQTLAERISGGQARDLASQLPEELRGCVAKRTENAEPFGLADFLERVQARAGVDLQSATDGARAVLDTLRESISAKEYGDFVDQLPKDFWQLSGPASTTLETRRVGT
ncbi:Uncharacterized conserved protein, DUF2267 family [Micromonospora rhizosphaerae]|uniref:Uncharacterized conserved protein, DUF2267 family n=1 Tax=Micromonospora rhizosphaerae TaxID=568872 RepID=A0A1C6SQ67_9ACTN|nr:DUF2267 domain-containing protein [Micromonospora rhizosphaerae]SCL31670.1 Uncharacterized conserved protein, DUF2267 family [Micromonospora rhizosphaerae]